MEEKTKRRERKVEVNKEKNKLNNKARRTLSFKVLKKPSNFTLVFTMAYIMLIILSIISRVSTLKYTSTTDVTFGTVMGEFILPIIVCALLVVTTMLYNKSKVYGAALEIAVGFSLVADVLVSVFTAGFDVVALLLTLVIPSILIIHSMLVIKSIKKEKKKSA